ncbi:MAG TPA: hypothetical protein VKW04_17365 [Planctomycetota bacterium]|nr:hypothetical protein [Planctomycetota bacterium]
MMHENVMSVHPLGLRWARRLGLLLVAGLIPACYSSSGKTYTAPMAPGGAGVLVSDNFFPYPSSNWAGATGSGATASEFFASPAYYLRMQETARPGTVSDYTHLSFTSEALTFQIDFRSSATSALVDQATIQITDGGTPPTTVLAQAVYDASAGTLTCSVGATTFTAVVYGAGAFQTVLFTIDTGFTGTWKVGATTVGSAAFGMHTTRLKLGATFASGSGAAPIFDFANLVISNP